MKTWRRVVVGAGISVLAVALGVLVAAALTTGDEGNGRPREALPVPQHSSAIDHGIEVSLRSAEFSGTATRLEMNITLLPGAPLPVADVVGIAIRRSALTGGSLSPVSDPAGAAVKQGEPGTTVLRMSPLNSAGPATVLLSEVILETAGGQTTVSGTWWLTAQPPADAGDLLATEALHGSGTASHDSVSVSVASALRSKSETLITLMVSGPAHYAVLGEPTLVAAGKSSNGALVEASGDDRLLTYSFPPTPFGTSAHLELGPLAAAIGGEDHYTDIDLGTVITAADIHGRAGERAVIPASAVVSSNAPNEQPVSIAFVEGPALRLEVAFNAPSQPHDPQPATLILTSGQAVQFLMRIVGYQRDSAGNIVGAITTIGFPAPALDELEGVVRIVRGASSEILRGPWALDLAP